MRTLLWLMAVFAAAAALAVFGRANEGIVLVVYPPWRVEVSLLLFALAASAVFALAYVATRLVHHTLGLPAQVRAFRERRRREQAQLALAAALLAYYEGRFARAEKEARLAWQAGAAPGLAALIAARAAHELREYERRDQWFERAAALGESMHSARLLQQAELLLDERDFVGARDALRSLRGAGPRHIATARMLLRAERGAQNWEEVLRLATLLGKRDAISPAIAQEYRVQAHIELLARAAGERDLLAARWRRIGAEDQAHPRVAAGAARYATALRDAPLAREMIERGLGGEWSAALLALYGELPPLEAREREREARTRLERAERWLHEHADDPQLLACLGKLCVAGELWGKALHFLEASVSLEESRAARLALAGLAEREGRNAEAQKQYRRAAELS
jgi:HemY protein